VLSLARALSKFGVCSRAEAGRRIEAGRVRVDGAIVRAPERRIHPRRNRIEVDGVRVGELRQPVAVVLHKPTGYLTTRTDPGGRPTVYDLLGGVGAWVFPVGRLDLDTSGLLILTNDHRLGDELADPEHHVPKTYHALVRGVPSAESLAVLRDGITLEDGTRCRPARVRALGAARPRNPAGAEAPGTSWLEITLTEGKNRQVRRMCAMVGHDVLELARVRIGGLVLGDLPRGAWRRLTGEDLARLRRRGG
jgi:23S rRNA pseudouridine2605 synthase